MIRFELHTDWPQRITNASVIHGYDSNRIAYTLGLSWWRFAVFVSRMWNRNGCVHIGPVKRFHWYRK